MNDIGIYFEYLGQSVQIPVNPKEIKIAGNGNNKNVEIIALGEISILKQRKLQTLEWSSWFPYYNWHPAIRSRIQGIDYYTEFFEQIVRDCRPCRLIITGLNISMEVSIESFQYHHQAGDHEDRYYTIQLKEYRPYNVYQINTLKSDLERWGTKLGNTTPPSKPEEKKEEPKPKEITVGCDVILNGRVHYDSYGSKPGKTFSNYKGKCNKINKKGSHPYHITTPSGGWLGWVVESAVQVV